MHGFIEVLWFKIFSDISSPQVPLFSKKKKYSCSWFIFSCNIVKKKSALPLKFCVPQSIHTTLFFAAIQTACKKLVVNSYFPHELIFLQLLLELMRPRNVCVYRLAQDTLSQKKMFTDRTEIQWHIHIQVAVWKALMKRSFECWWFLTEY